ncbi:hypothetical protein [Shewanella waksmanii]|uniref:hypothetical protein n=1 Tax=Shewanella waksmanii TaxID=213783 RepID=UPI003736308F
MSVYAVKRLHKTKHSSALLWFRRVSLALAYLVAVIPFGLLSAGTVLFFALQGADFR